jgi:UDPglucose 6-dehydrogenase
LLNLYEPLNVPIYITDPTTSELAKITINSLRATIITFWNQINTLARSLNVDTSELAEIVDTANTIGKYEGGNWGTKVELFGKPYGGKCLPKDIKQLINTFKEVQLEDSLFTTVEDINNKLNTKLVYEYD